VGGHTVGSSIAFIPDEKVLFSGDLIFERTSNFGLPFMGFYQNRPKKNGNPEEHLSAYRKFLRWGVEIIVPGHGNIIKDGQTYLKDQIEFFKQLRKFIRAEIEENKTVEEINLPRLTPLAQAYADAESRQNRSQVLRWLTHYVDELKKSFYLYYSQNQRNQ
jgi:glyoxylase-like metal-dependent hydrolase (beta-lactamase superfamily II)